MGDLNYRVELDPDEVLQSLVDIYRHEESAAWQHIHSYEQLIQCMAYGDAFQGFTEVNLPCFPPTYRRARGDAGDCQGYVNIDKLKASYTTCVSSKSGKVNMIL